MTHEEALLLYKETEKTVKRYLKRWIVASDSEAFNDIVQTSMVFSVRYWGSPRWAGIPLQKKLGISAARGFLHAIRSNSAPFKSVRSTQNRAGRKQTRERVERVRGEASDVIMAALADSGAVDRMDRAYDVQRIFSYKELSDKQKDLAKWVLEHDPTTLSEYPSATSKQAVSDLWCRMLRHLEA